MQVHYTTMDKDQQLWLSTTFPDPDELIFILQLCNLCLLENRVKCGNKDIIRVGADA